MSLPSPKRRHELSSQIRPLPTKDHTFQSFLARHRRAPTAAEVVLIGFDVCFKNDQLPTCPEHSQICRTPCYGAKWWKEKKNMSHAQASHFIQWNLLTLLCKQSRTGSESALWFYVAGSTTQPD